MNYDPPANQIPVLFVSDGHDEDIACCAEELRTAGIAIAWSPDVYAAMSQLAGVSGRRRVVVDVRPMDEQELVFLQLAPRYFAEHEFLVPLLPNAANRLQHLRGRFQAMTLEGIADLAVGIRAAVPADTDDDELVSFDEDDPVQRLGHDDDALTRLRDEPPPADLAELPGDGALPMPALDALDADIPEAITIEESAAEPPPAEMTPAARLSTDGTDTGVFENSLHEEVRRRMSGGAAGRAVRRPPMPRSVEAPRPAPADALLTPAELDALLERDPAAGELSSDDVPGGGRPS